MDTPAASQQAPLPERSRYHVEVDTEDPNSVYAMQLQMVGSNKRVIEFGCSSGHMTVALAERGCRVVGVDMDAAATAANEAAERVLVADLDRADFSEDLRGDHFDVALFGDVLEHLRDPLATLRAVRECLVPGGYVVVSVPNIAHVDVKLALLNGRFPYGDRGLLDRTHVHFFTREALDQMLADAGFLPVEISRAIVPAFGSELAPDRDVPREVLAAALQHPEALTYQFVVKAVLDDGDLALRMLAQRCLGLEEQLRMSSTKREPDTVVADGDRVEMLTRELNALRGTKLFRYSAPARALYARLHRHRSR
jgi:2-polyprenyl-3-methyl-5-hydroxy-6-metoxy-1,4-benzoquinol methylase